MIPCLNNATIKAADLDVFLDAASQAGFEAVELSIDWAQAYAAAHSLQALGELLEAKGLQPASFGLPLEWRKDEASWQASLEDLPPICAFAAQLGLTRAVTWMPARLDMPYREAVEWAAERLRPAVDICAEQAIVLGLEYVAPQGGFPGTHKFVTTMGELWDLLRAIARPNAGVLLDSYHWYVGGSEPADLARLPAGRIAQVHVNDADPDLPREELKDLERLLPGEGCIDLVGFLQAVKAAGYDDTVSVETFDQSLVALGPFEAARRAKVALDNVLSQVA
jgi:sugar phosphate isomerase/epimerase